MLVEVPMVAKMKLSFNGKIEFDSFIDGSLEVSGPFDKDGDGDPEIEFHAKADLPGEAFDMDETWRVEIPVATIMKNGIAGIADIGMKNAPDFPFKSMVLKSVEQLLNAEGD